jgi:hypothetical protein
MPRGENLPYQFLLKASVPTLESFELSRLNHAANLKKQIEDLIEQYLDESTAALLARAMILRMHRSRPNSVYQKRQLPAPRSISSTRAISSPRSISTSRAISSTRSVSSARSILHSKTARQIDVQPDLPFDILLKSRAR